MQGLGGERELVTRLNMLQGESRILFGARVTDGNPKARCRLRSRKQSQSVGCEESLLVRLRRG